MGEREKKKYNAHRHDKICATTHSNYVHGRPLNTHANSVTSLSNLHMMTLLGAIQKLRGPNFTQFRPSIQLEWTIV